MWTEQDTHDLAAKFWFDYRSALQGGKPSVAVADFDQALSAEMRLFWLDLARRAAANAIEVSGSAAST
jgi:hypothetical protein